MTRVCVYMSWTASHGHVPLCYSRGVAAIPIIPVIPVAVWRVFKLDASRPNVVSIDHSLCECPGCGVECWIGPAQKRMADDRLGLVLCYGCIVLSGMPLNAPATSLNPDIDSRPRRG
jgi:hypothetical protein